jgi:hypothetical protein
LRDAVGQRRAFDQLHDESAGAVGLFEAVDLRDVGMIQYSERLRLALEARQPLGIAREGVRQNLDGNLAPKVGVERAVDLAHSALAEFGGDFVRADMTACGERQARTGVIIRKRVMRLLLQNGAATSWLRATNWEKRSAIGRDQCDRPGLPSKHE